MKQEMVDLDEIQISRSVNIKQELVSEGADFISVSHYRIISISYDKDDKYYIQFTNLLTNEQVNIDIEDGHQLHL